MAAEAQIRVIYEIRGCYIFRVHSCQLVAKILCVFVASWLNTKIAHFESIMQNKPNLLDAQMNVTSLITVDYENKSNWKLGENKPNSKPIQSQNKPNSKPIQSQYKANTMPKQTQSNPIYLEQEIGMNLLWLILMPVLAGLYPTLVEKKERPTEKL